MSTEVMLPAPDLAVVDYRAKAAAIRADAAARVALVKPLNDDVRKFNAAFEEALQPVVQADRDLRRKMLDYDTAERRLAAEAAARAERERLEAEAMLVEAERAEAAGKGAVAEQLLGTAVAREESAKVAATQAVAPPKTVAFGAGTATVRKVWTFKVLDVETVPR